MTRAVAGRRRGRTDVELPRMGKSVCVCVCVCGWVGVCGRLTGDAACNRGSSVLCRRGERVCLDEGGTLVVEVYKDGGRTGRWERIRLDG